MKKIIRFAWLCACIIVIVLFIISCCSAYVSPASFSYMPLFALCFPYFFLAIILLGIIFLFTNKKIGLLFFIVACAGIPDLSKTIAFNFPSSFNKNKTDSTFRILTWNVQSFVKLNPKATEPKEMLQIIKDYNPDIVCMQEMMNIEGAKRRISMRYKMDSIGYKYYFFSNDGISQHKNVTRTTGCVIFSKYPIIDSGRVSIASNVTEENLVYADVQFNSHPLRVFTAHLQSFKLYPDTNNMRQDIYEITYSRKRAIQYKLRDIEKFHVNEVSIIRNQFSKTSIPFIYCGDMNTVPTSYTYKYLKGDLQDAFLEKGAGIGATFYKILPTLRIDYIFPDKNFTVTQCAVINKKISDHYPVITDLQWK